MSESGQFETYSDYFSYLWQKLGTGQPDPQTLTRLIAAEGSWMQEPDATAATARPNLDEVDGWARKIEGTKAFSRMMENPKLGERIAARDAEGLMIDLHEELTGGARDKPDAPELERAAKKEQRREGNAREAKEPEPPSLTMRGR
ncbi:MAG: hypothetical protein IJQ98_08380 [Oscillospiraceae bacterium]|nr:hypothetical protein [Oscillospiraceae bacterium]